MKSSIKLLVARTAGPAAGAQHTAQVMQVLHTLAGQLDEATRLPGGF